MDLYKLLLFPAVVIVSIWTYAMFNPVHAMTFKRAKILFSHLENKAGRHVVLSLDNDPYVDAYSSNNHIWVTQGLLNFVSSDDELMLVLGHELGHIATEDYRVRNPINPKKYEFRADTIGYAWCRGLGYKQCLKFMHKMKKSYADGGDNDTHPSWSGRIKNIQTKR